MDNKERNYLQELKNAHTKRVRLLRVREAKLGLSCPPEIILEIADIEEKIEQIDQQLKGSKPTIATPLSKAMDKDGDKQISVTMLARHWVVTMAALDQLVTLAIQQAKRLNEEGKSISDLDKPMMTAIAGPIIARAILVDALVQEGIMNADVQKRGGTEKILELAEQGAKYIPKDMQ